MTPVLPSLLLLVLVYQCAQKAQTFQSELVFRCISPASREGRWSRLWRKHPAQDPYVKRGSPNKHLEKHLNDSNAYLWGKVQRDVNKPSVISDPHQPRKGVEAQAYPGLYVTRHLSQMDGDGWQPVMPDPHFDMRTYNYYTELAENCSFPLMAHSQSQAIAEGWDGLGAFTQWRDGVRLLPPWMRAEADPTNVAKELPIKRKVGVPVVAFPHSGMEPTRNVRSVRQAIQDSDWYEGYRAPVPEVAKDAPLEERAFDLPVGAQPRRPLRNTLDYYKRDAFKWFKGSRKTAKAFVRIARGNGDFLVNGRQGGEYFRHNFVFVASALAAGEATGHGDSFDVVAHVRGGGLGGQSDAIGLGFARALASHIPDTETFLKVRGLLTPDVRQVERKKAGQKKARKGYVWVKR
eukprot:GHVN01001373.1.p2 GENE.GHVN01001373.1~~GHVN01001373.1.p2  ORF type:complete len:405 (+),score=27.79 GHVN01001373.1:1416-2630(+)